MTQHTPGPWFVTPDDFAVYEKDEYGYRGDTICTVPAGDPAIRAANARAIAALPDLLEACQTLATLLDTDDWFATGRLAVEQARAAIAKARGV
jgi:hypothetical protein